MCLPSSGKGACQESLPPKSKQHLFSLEQSVSCMNPPQEASIFLLLEVTQASCLISICLTFSVEPKIHPTWTIFFLRIPIAPLVWGIWALSWPSHERKDLKRSRDFYFCPFKKKKNQTCISPNSIPNIGIFVFFMVPVAPFSVCKYSWGFGSCLGERIILKNMLTYIYTYLIGSSQGVSADSPGTIPHPSLYDVGLPPPPPPAQSPALPWFYWTTRWTGEGLSWPLFPFLSLFLSFLPCSSSCSCHFEIIPTLSFFSPVLSWAASLSGSGGFSTCSV